MLGRLFALLPVGTPAFRVALLSACAAAVTVALLFLACRRVTGNPEASFAAALLFAVAPVHWKLAGIPEVFSLLGLCAAAILCVSLWLARGAARHGTVGCFLLGCLFGLGLANHHTIVLVAPLGLYGFWAGTHALDRVALLCRLGAAGLGLVVGLLPYAWLPYAAHHGAFVWGEPDSLHGLVRHFFRVEYGTLSLGLAAAPPKPLAHVGATVATVARGFLYVFAVIGLVGVAHGLRHACAPALALFASFFLSGVLLPARFNLPEGFLAEAVAERFHLLPALLSAPFVAWGLASVLPRLSQVMRFLTLGAALLLGALASFPTGNWRNERTVEQYLVAAMAELEPRAIILGQGDLELFGFHYVRHVLKLRPDVSYVDLNLLRHPWYHARLQQEIPEAQLPFDPQTTRVVQVAAACSRVRPTYLTMSVATLPHTLPVYPEGLLARVALPPSAPPSPEVLEARIFRATEPLRRLGFPLDAWATYVRSQAALPWRSLGAAYAQAGNPAKATYCLHQAETLEHPGRTFEAAP